MTRYWGKYRGQVISNKDPESLGRVQVSVPEVLGSHISSWAMPCVPIAGLSAGMYAIPPIRANVWVEFEGGDPEKPIWTGCFWGKGELPQRAQPSNQPQSPLVLQAPTSQMRVVIGVSPQDGVTLETSQGASGPMVKVDTTGITIQDGQGGTITIQGGSVTVNNGALTVR